MNSLMTQFDALTPDQQRLWGKCIIAALAQGAMMAEKFPYMRPSYRDLIHTGESLIPAVQQHPFSPANQTQG